MLMGVLVELLQPARPLALAEVAVPDDRLRARTMAQ